MRLFFLPYVDEVNFVYFASDAYIYLFYRFLLKVLKDFGFGKQCMEDLVLEDTNMLCNILRDKMLDTAINVHDFSEVTAIAVISSLWHLIAGRR